MFLKNLWLKSIIEEPNIVSELTPVGIKAVTRSSRCVVCRGSKFLCGKTRCPILVRFYSLAKVKPLTDTLTLEGSSPGIFIGRFGFPFVQIGPLMTPTYGDTSFLDTPELWHGKSIEEIVDFRSQLVRGKYRTHVKNVTQGKIVELTRELALSKSSTEAEAEFLKKPSGRLVLDDEVQPFGPSAPLKSLSVSSVKTEQKIEKVFSDTDLKASEAVVWLYQKGVLVSSIQRAFSAGLLGIEKNRKFVPTRWSITAVDSIISQNLLEEVKTFPLINEFRVYCHEALDNRWIVLMIPSFWSYELIEAWYPKTVWNPAGREVAIYSDWEGFEGRTTYASIGGCYYAGRLSVCDALLKERRQAAIVILREVHPGFILPLGVWNVRENVKECLEKPSLKFNKIEDAFEYISTKLSIPLKKWIGNSYILRNNLQQKKITTFLTTKVE